MFYAVLILIGVTLIFYFIFQTTQVSLLGLPIAESWADLAGAFAGAAALFTGLALVGVAFTLHQQAKDAKENAESLRNSLKKQSEGVAGLEKAATNIARHVEAAQKHAETAVDQAKSALKNAEAAVEQNKLLATQLEQQNTRAKADRLYKLVERFVISDRPDAREFQDLKDDDKAVKVDDVRQRLPAGWRSSLFSLLIALDRTEAEKGENRYLKEVRNDIIEELKAHISDNDKRLLTFSELPHNAVVESIDQNAAKKDEKKAYEPSRFAKLLAKYGLFSYAIDMNRGEAYNRALNRPSK
ncbi:MAG: hypothetical protein Q4G36_06810 [Paracoccus sp. (in: a-proteobacteria)]|nr:hypothetical protein [Paracoccus sp. (in: a-proteobacteria)]